MKKTFKFTLKTKWSDKIHNDELGPGVLAIKEEMFNLTPKDYKSTLFAARLFDTGQEFKDSLIEVEIEEI